MLIVDSPTEPIASLLDTVNSPRDLRKLSLPQMEQLAKELRKTIITTVAQTGGHLAPSLGVVELSISHAQTHHSFHHHRRHPPQGRGGGCR